MAKRQNGFLVKIGSNWYVRSWERRVVNGVVVRQRVSHKLGPVTTKGKKPPADVVAEAAQHMAGVNTAGFAPEQIVTVGDFVERIYIPRIKEHKRPSTAKGYQDIWRLHLRPVASKLWLKNVRTHQVQEWLDELAKRELSSNTLKHVKSVESAIFRLAKQLDCFHGENPTRDTVISPKAARPIETHAYSLDEIDAIQAALPTQVSIAFAVAGFTGLRLGEIQGLRWEDYREGHLHVTRNIWNGHVGAPKTKKSSAPVPVIPRLAHRLELHRLATGNPADGPIFRNALGRPMGLASLVHRVILPALNRCVVCGKPELGHNAAHEYVRDGRLPTWHGWHAARRGLGSNLYRLGIAPKVIQAILRHSDVSTTVTYYIKTQDEDVRMAMLALESSLPTHQQGAPAKEFCAVSVREPVQ
jgi:integrase